jgi:hypothetical protein
VLTDSGGVQGETTCLNGHCFTLREHTGRPVTLTMGVNTVLGLEPKRITDAFREDADELGTSRERRTYWPGYMRLAEILAVSPLHLLPQSMRRALRRSVERVLWSPRETPSLDDALRGRLEALYASEVNRLGSLTGKAFPTWSI